MTRPEAVLVEALERIAATAIQPIAREAREVLERYRATSGLASGPLIQQRVEIAYGVSAAPSEPVQREAREVGRAFVRWFNETVPCTFGDMEQRVTDLILAERAAADRRVAEARLRVQGLIDDAISRIDFALDACSWRGRQALEAGKAALFSALDRNGKEDDHG